MIRESGYIDYLGHKCTFVRDNMTYYIIPVDENDNITKLFVKKDFIIDSTDVVGKRNRIKVKKQQPISKGLKVEASYIVDSYSSETINEFILTGDEIDSFFSMVEYHYLLKKEGNHNNTDLLYESEEIVDYPLKYKNYKIIMKLKCGNVFSFGVLSDQTIHSQLVFTVEETIDIEIVYDFVTGFMNFLRLVNGKYNLNLRKIELFHNEEGNYKHVGNMLLTIYDFEKRSIYKCDAAFLCFGSKLNRLIDVIIGDDKFSTYYLDTDYPNFNSYTSSRFIALCAAFEYEYRKNITLYEDKTNLDDIRDKVLDVITKVKAESSNEKIFIQKVNNSINNITSLSGLKTRIKNAYNTNKGCLDSSLNHLNVYKKTINKIAEELVKTRGTITHESFDYQLTHDDNNNAYFLAVLYYAMILRRCDYTQDEITFIIGNMFSCNECAYSNPVIWF